MQCPYWNSKGHCTELKYVMLSNWGSHRGKEFYKECLLGEDIKQSSLMTEEGCMEYHRMMELKISNKSW